MSSSSQASTIVPMDVPTDSSLEFQNGMIVRITLTNFVTYSFIEFILQPKMNMILGPNGSGKSTVLCAIVLGLGGKPSIIGRSSNVADYVKRDTERAVIEIELFCNNSDNKVIKRIFDIRQRTEWYFQNNKVAFNKIKEVIDFFNINIENLCQLLPQDRVHDFAKMTKPQLLDATQTCAGDKRLSEWFADLKTFKTNSVNARRMYENINRKIEIETEKLEKLKELVRKYNEQKAFLDNIGLMKKKVNWLEYEEVETLQKQAREKFDITKKGYLEESKTTAPIDKAIKTKLGEIQEIENIIKQYTEDIAKIKQEEKIYNRKFTQLLDDINAKKQEINDLLLFDQSKEADIKTLMQQISNIENSLPQVTEKDLLSEIGSIDQKIMGMQRQKNDLRSTETNLEQKFATQNQKYLAMESRARQILNTQDNKLKLLAENSDLQSAYDWLSSNQHLFNKKIHGPMFMEINTNDASKAKYVEQCVPYQDLMAFVCEDSNDLSKFFTIISEQHNLHVNVLHSSPPKRNVFEMFYPNVALSELSQFGFTNFVLDFVDAPPAILKLLCTKYHIHTIPVGPANAADNMSKVPTKISTYIYGDQVFRVKKSRYSNERISQIHPIHPAKFLAFSINKELLKTTEATLKMSKESLTAIKQELDGKREAVKDIEVNVNQLKNKKRNINSSIENIKVSHSRLNMKKKELQSLQEANVDIDIKQAECHQLSCANIKKGTEILAKINDINEKISKVEIKLECKKISCEGVSKQITELKKQKASLERSSRELLKKVEQTKLEYVKISDEAKSLLSKAQNATEGLIPGDAGFKERFGIFSTFPNVLDELIEAIMLAESEIQDQNLLNRQVLEDDQKQEKLIDNLKKESEKLNQAFGSESQRLSTLKTKWISSINALIKDINENFSSYLKFLGCAGSVELDKGQNEDDFDNYGLCIKVKFRDEGTLQELNAHVQSGGERSMTTAIFLLALQNLIKVPFRIVDEINQGMDAFNEQRVYFLIMNAVSKDPSAQYILITPKLLEETKISMETTLHNIYAGNVQFSQNIDESSDSDTENSPVDVSWSVDSYLDF